MKTHCLILSFILCLMAFPICAKENNSTPNSESNKGKMYVFWGWNRGWYSNSDIHFFGNNYDFELKNVKAKDRPSPFDFSTYFGLTNFSIPQTNYGLGFFINDKYDISVAVDHMKYVMVTDQNSTIYGNINDETEFDGSYSGEDIVITQNLLVYEHTDGLNYLNAEITRNDDLLKLFHIQSNANKIQLNTLIGVGLGAVMPKSNIKLWHNQRHDAFHFAGYGFAAKTGLNATFFKHFFIRTEYKVGYINMPDVRTTFDPSDRASQHFAFTQWVFNFGAVFKLFNYNN